MTKAINNLGMINTSKEKYFYLFCHEKKSNILLCDIVIGTFLNYVIVILGIFRPPTHPVINSNAKIGQN